MASIAMMIGGAVVNALAFTGSSFLFSKLGKKDDGERERHDHAVEQLAAAKDEWQQQRTRYMDYLRERLESKGLAVKKLASADDAMKYYNYITGSDETLPPQLQREPSLQDFYEPSDNQVNAEIAFVAGGTILIGFLAYRYL